MNFLPEFPLQINPPMAFGMLLLVGAVGGYIAHRLSWLPSITGFIAVGFALGPGGLGFLGEETIAQSRIFIDIALALILYRLGLSLDLKIIARNPALIAASLLESAGTFGLVAWVLTHLGSPMALSLLVAAIAISSSPAVLLHVAHEVGAKGPTTESAKTLVALNNMISFVVFSALLPVAHWASDASWSTIILQPLYGLAGSSVLGITAAYGLHAISLKTHEAGQYKLALVIGVMMVVIGIAGALKLSMLFVPLAVGVTIRFLERTTVISDLEFGAAFELFFIILFVFAGAGLHIRELLHYAPAVLAVVGVRIAMKLAGVTSVLVLGRRPFRTAVAGGLLLIPMAGLAIGLAQTTGLLFPHYTAAVSAIVLGAVTVFETIGPPIASLAFRLAGESEEVRQQKEERSEVPVETEIPVDAA